MIIPLSGFETEENVDLDLGFGIYSSDFVILEGAEYNHVVTVLCILSVSTFPGEVGYFKYKILNYNTTCICEFSDF